MAKAVELVPYFAKKDTTLLIFLPGCHRPILRVQCCLMVCAVCSFDRATGSFFVFFVPQPDSTPESESSILEAGGTEQAVRPVFVFRGAYDCFLSISCMIRIFRSACRTRNSFVCQAYATFHTMNVQRFTAETFKHIVLEDMGLDYQQALSALPSSNRTGVLLTIE